MPQNLPHNRSASTPSVWLEVARGRTRYPRRPVLQSRFLIGAGSNCTLQLGGEGVPFLHSMLLIEHGDVTIESFVASPPLLLNGHPVRTALLRDGDLLAIGEFEFNLHVDTLALDKQRTAPLDDSDDELEATPFVDEDLSEVSAAELVNLLEAEMDDIEEFEESQRSGLAALLDAAWLAGESTAATKLDDTVPSPLGAAAIEANEVDETEAQLLEEMLELSQELESRLEQLRQDEAVQAGRGASLLEAQDQLVEQLARLAGTLKSQESIPSKQRARA